MCHEETYLKSVMNPVQRSELLHKTGQHFVPKSSTRCIKEYCRQHYQNTKPIFQGGKEAALPKQINHMMQFIEQEANEKVEEIDAKAEEEFNIEKGRLVQEQRLKIIEYFDKKEKQVELQRKIQSSNMLNQARLKVLKAREDHIRSVLDEAKKKLHSKTRDQGKYQEVLKNLILQAIFQLLEPQVSVKCRKADVELVENSLSSIMKEYEAEVGKPCKVILDKDNFLSPDCAGGIELTAQKGKIKINNTLESRLDMISQQLLPEIRETLFGPNPNRKFKD